MYLIQGLLIYLEKWRNKDILLLPIVNYGFQKFAYHNICRHQETFH